MEICKKVFTVFFFCSFLFFERVSANSSDCTSSSDEITCQTEFGGQYTTFNVKIKSCREKPSVKVSISGSGLDWQEEFDSSNNVAIPGFSSPLGGIYLSVELDSNRNGYLKLKLQVFAKAALIGRVTPKFTILDQNIAHSDCNGFLYWWNSQSTGVKVGVSIGSGVFLIALIVCCCYCSGCCKNKTQSQSGIVMAPYGQPSSPAVVTTNNIAQMSYPYNHRTPSNASYTKLKNQV